MRVGFIDDEPQIYPLQYGGKARTILALARSALELDEIDEVTVMSRSIEDPRDEFTDFNGVNFERLDDHNMMSRIAEEAENADILSVHTCSFTFPQIPEERRRAALIYHLHDVMLTTADKGSHLDKALGGDWDAIVSPSPFATQTFRNFAEVTGKVADIHTIPRGIDPELFHKVPKQEAFEKLRGLGVDIDETKYPILFFPGRADVGKGDDRLAQICEALEEYPDRMVITTSDVDSPKQHPNVTHVGWQESQSLKYFYAAADMTLALSKLPESFSQVCIESVACDAPVLTFPFGNLPGLSKSLPAIRLCEPFTEGIIASVKGLLTDKEVRNALDQSQETIDKNYSIKGVSKTYLQLYEDIIRHRSEALQIPSMYFLSPFSSVYSGKAYLSNNENAPLKAYDLSENEEKILVCCAKASSEKELEAMTGLESEIVRSTLSTFINRKIIMGGRK